MKKLGYKILKLTWGIIGIVISVFTFLMYLRMNSPIGLGIVGWVILFSIGIYSMFLYIVITFLFLIIKWIIKKIKGRKKK
ncbi:Uncharacterised protein [uncultured archaeon]|nr:Uncharacterised protein [uncultured archaeon]